MRLLPVLLFSLSACSAATDRPLSVRQVIENAAELDGQVIVVSGWIEDCRPLSCPLYGSASEVAKEWPYSLSVGRSRWFDDFTERHAPTRVNLRARFRNRCIADPVSQTIGVCADRSTTLEPLGVGR